MAIDPMWLLAGLGGLGTLGSLFGGGGDRGAQKSARQGQEYQNALLKNMLQQLYMTQTNPQQAGMMGSELEHMLSNMGNMLPGMQEGASGQINAYNQILQQMMGQGMQAPTASSTGLINLMNSIITNTAPGAMEQGQQRGARQRLLQQAMAGQMSPEQMQHLTQQAYGLAQDPSQAWGMGPHVGQITPGQVTAGTVTPQGLGYAAMTPQQEALAPAYQQLQQRMQAGTGLSDVFSGQLQRQAAAQLAGQGISSPALAAEAASQAAAPYLQQQGEFEQQMLGQLGAAEQGVMGANVNRDLQAQMQNIANALQAGEFNVNTDLQAQMQNIANQLQAGEFNVGTGMQAQMQNIANQLQAAGMGENLYQMATMFPGMFGQQQQNLLGNASQLFGQPLFDVSQLAHASQTMPTNQYERMLQMVASLNAPGPGNLQNLMAQLWGQLHGGQSPTAGVPQAAQSGGIAPNFMGLLPLFSMLEGQYQHGGGGGVGAYTGSSPDWAGGGGMEMPFAANA